MQGIEQDPSKRDPFPLSLFLLLVVYYMAQPFVTSYISIYQSSVGMSKTLIGLVGAGIALVALFVKPIFGAMADKAHNKNTIAFWLILITAGAAVLFYVGYLFEQQSTALFVHVSVCTLLYQTGFGIASTLIEANGVELLNERKGRWHFGHIRIGGTVGFMISALLSSLIIAGNHFERMFVVVFFYCIISAFWVRKLPPVSGKAKKKEHVPYSEILKNRPFLAILLLQFTNSMGMAFNRYFNIYLTDTSVNALGRPNGLSFDTGFVGVLAFCNAALEIPFFWFAGKIRDKLGMRWFMTIAVMMNVTKNLLFSFVTSKPTILLSTMVTGFSFVGIQFCTVNFLNDHMPRKMRSTAQALNGLVHQVLGAIVVGAFGGWFADRYSVPVMLRVGAGIVALGGVVFFFFFGFAMKDHNRRYGPNMVPLGPDGRTTEEDEDAADD